MTVFALQFLCTPKKFVSIVKHHFKALSNCMVTICFLSISSWCTLWTIFNFMYFDIMRWKIWSTTCFLVITFGRIKIFQSLILPIKLFLLWVFQNSQVWGPNLKADCAKSAKPEVLFLSNETLIKIISWNTRMKFSITINQIQCVW